MADPVSRGREWLEELKRRGVVRVAVVYVAVAFVVLQAAEILVPLLLLPEVVARIVLAMLILGLPIALVLGWAYELTPEGVRRAEVREGFPTGHVSEAPRPAGEKTATGDELAADGRSMVGSAEAVPRPWLSPSTAALAGVLLLVALGLWWGTGRVDLAARAASGASEMQALERNAPARLVIAPPPGTRFTEDPFDVAISPDGEVVVFAATDGDSVRFYQRRIDEYEARTIPGAAGSYPFFSPDGGWVAYGADDRLWKVSLVGGQPQPLAEIVTGFGGGVWGGDGRIVYADGGVLFRVPASGGEPERLLGGGWFSSHPRWLVEGERLLATQDLAPGRSGVVVHRIESGEIDVLVEQGHNARFLASEGVLLYHLGRELLGARFDPAQPNALGPPVPVLSDVAVTGPREPGNVALASDGTLVYLADRGARARSRLVWVDTAGRVEALSLPEDHGYQGMRISPEGDRIVFTRSLPGEPNLNVWVYDTPSGHLRQVTRDQGNNWWPIWGPDGERILHNSNRDSADEPGMGLDLYSTPLGSGGEPELLAETRGSIQPQSWTPDGKFLAFVDNTIQDGVEGEETLRDIWILSFEGNEPERRPFRRTRFDEMHASFSPDGRWLAYVSDESGEREVYVTDFPEKGSPRRVSSGGGVEPVWAPDGDALYHRSPDGNRVYRTRVDASAAEAPEDLEIGNPQMLFEGSFRPHRPWGRMYDLHPDGDRFLMLQILTEGPEASERRDLRVVLGWLGEVRERLP